MLEDTGYLSNPQVLATETATNRARQGYKGGAETHGLAVFFVVAVFAVAFFLPEGHHVPTMMRCGI